MTVQNACGNVQPQFLTRDALFTSQLARIHTFDGITHDKALEILYDATVARQLETTREPIPRHQWGKYFELPVMSVNDVAGYYGLKAKKIKTVISGVPSYLKELFEGGLLVLRDKAIEDACKQLGTPLTTNELILLPPQAVLRMCLFLPAIPTVVATVDTLWNYAVSEELSETTSADWEKTCYRYRAIHCDRISDRELVECLVKAKELNLYPYVQHFGQQDCLKTWSSLFAYEGEFPPPRGDFYRKKHTWLDRISDVCLRE
ncbi:hypothetical protein [Microcoleus sp. D2_18a_D3]|uniref:hypothetical protein n=1 Tax=Microcoleus sp. D2_18a_D3 TaxID=3055330 RepID=UPI002FD0C8E2